MVLISTPHSLPPLQHLQSKGPPYAQTLPVAKQQGTCIAQTLTVLEIGGCLAAQFYGTLEETGHV